MTKKRDDRDVKSVAFSLTDAYEKKLYAHAQTQGKFSAYVKRLIDRDMNNSPVSPQTPPQPSYMPQPSYHTPEPQSPPTPSPEPPMQAVTKPYIVPQRAASNGFAGMY